MTGAAGALLCLTDDINFIRESSKRKTIFNDMCASGRMNHLEHLRYYVVSNCGIITIIQAIVHDGCPSQLASNKLRRANKIVNIFVNNRPILNMVVSLDYN